MEPRELERESERAADEMHETDSSALLSCTHKPSHATQLITTSVNIASTWVNIVNRRVNIVNMQKGEYCGYMGRIWGE